MAVFRKKTEDGRPVRDWSAMLFLVLVLMLISAVAGIAVGITNFNSNKKLQAINEYVDSTVVFSVVGHGSYQGAEDSSRSDAVVEAYDAAYAEALEKASLIAANSGNNWRITKVEEVESVWTEETHTADTVVRMSFSVASETAE